MRRCDRHQNRPTTALFTVLLSLVVASVAPAFAAPGSIFRQVATYRPPDGPVQAAYLGGPTAALHVDNKALRGVDLATGTVRWEVPTAAPIRQSRTIGPDALLIAGDAIAVDLASGAARWTYPLNCPSLVQCSQRVLHADDQYVVVAGYDRELNQINVIDTASGQLRWPTWATVPTAQFATRSGDVIVVTGAKAPYPIVGISARTGAQLWSLGAGLGTKPLAGMRSDEGQVFVWTHAANGPEVVAIDPAGGKVRGRIALGQSRIADSATTGISPGWAALDSGMLLTYDRRSAGEILSVRNLPDGGIVWQKPLALASPPTVAGNFVIVHRRDGGSQVIEAYGLRDGKLRSTIAQRNRVKNVRAEVVGSLIQVGIAGTRPIVLGLDPSTGQLMSAALPKAPDNVGLDSISGWANTLVVVAGGTIYQLEARPVGDLVTEIAGLLDRKEEGKARELFNDVHDLVGSLPDAAALTKLMTNYDLLVVESGLTSGDYDGAANRLMALTTPERLRFVGDLDALIEASSDLLTRKLQGLAPMVASRGTAASAIQRAVAAMADSAKQFETELAADPALAQRVEDGLTRLAFFLHRTYRSELALQLLARLSAATWTRDKTGIDNYRAAALITTAQAMLSSAKDDYKSRNYVEAWASLREVLLMPGMDSLISAASSHRSVLDSVDPEERAGKKEVKRIQKAMVRELSGIAASESSWTIAACEAECAKATTNCQRRPCAERRRCEDNAAQCRQGCNSSDIAPQWPSTQPAAPQSPEWWRCR